MRNEPTPATPTDDEFVRATLEGDREAFAGLVRRYREPMIRLAFRYVGNTEDARDLSQDGFVRAFERLGRYRIGTRFDRWLSRIVANLCRDHLRRRARVRFDELGTADDAPASSMTPDQAATWSDLRAQFQRALNDLPDDWRVAFLLHEQDGMKHEQIAAIVGSNARTIRWRLFKARERLRERLGDFLEP